MNDKRVKFSIIVPCYNEASNIGFLIEAFSFLGKRDDTELIIVDNGSTDATSGAIREIIPKYPFSHSIRVNKNQGYGYGILAGLKAAKGSYVGWTHGDLQFNPEDVLKAVEIINHSGDDSKIFVKGKRHNRPVLDILFTCGMSVFESVYMKMFLWDINGQPSMFHRSLMNGWKNPPHDFSLDLYAFVMAKKQCFITKRFDVFLRERLCGTSSWNKGFIDRFKLIKNVVFSSLKIKKDLLL